jgi:tripartite ATP-independent transporter DctM subunit
VEYLTGLVLAVDVVVVFLSVIFRYFLHSPIEWAEEVARSFMVILVFFGAASALGKSQHVGIDSIRKLLPAKWEPAIIQLCHWIIMVVSAGIFISSVKLVKEVQQQTTSMGLPQSIFVYPIVVGSIIMLIFSIANALRGPKATAWKTLALSIAVALIIYGWTKFFPEYAPKPFFLMIGAFVMCMVFGVPIAFTLAFCSLLYFLLTPFLPVVVYSQQIGAGMDHYVLLSIPFFVLAGFAMEVNGMSSRLIELLLRLMGRIRGGLNLIMITAMAFFSGISGSKLADVAAVGGVLMPAVRKTKQDANEAAGLLASSAVMAETIPPCVNMIIMGFVSNISIAALFIAGLIPAAVMAVALAVIAVYYGKKIKVDEVFVRKAPWLRLIGGSLVGLVMILMIGKGVVSGVATSTEISSFAVIYALVVGGLAFRELTVKSVIKLFVNAASVTGMILFIVAAAGSISYALTIEQIPHQLSSFMIGLAHSYGSWTFMLMSVLLLVIFGAVLEGAPALIIFGPLLTPIAQQLGIHPVHFGTVLVIAMGLGLFAPPLGLGIYATCVITETKVQDVARPMAKYLLTLFIVLLVLAFVPYITLWLPKYLSMI